LRTSNSCVAIVLANMDVSSAIETAIADYVNNWFRTHPTLGWLVSHPFWGFAIGVLFVLLIIGFFQAIGRLFERVWLSILKTPWQLLQSIFQAIWNVPDRLVASRRSDLLADPTTRSREIASTLDRLSQLQSEQLQLLERLQKLTADDDR
jgi:hypothetical protein